METNLKDCALSYYSEGYSCSESVVLAAHKVGLIDDNLVNVATGFSGGISSGCLCGAISGAVIVIGYLHGKNKTNKARVLSKRFIEEFKNIHKATCCRALTSGFKDFHSNERRAHCFNMVESSCIILDKILKEAKQEV